LLLLQGTGSLTQRLLDMPQRPFALTVIANAGADTLAVHELQASASAGRLEARALEYAWPPTVFSLSHVALPFPPDDPLYGYAAPQVATHVQLGRLEARGENGVLAIPTWMLTRLRSNPFYPYLAERVWTFVNDRTPAPAATPHPPPQAP
jgi:hypothetical protein